MRSRRGSMRWGEGDAAVRADKWYGVPTRRPLLPAAEEIETPRRRAIARKHPEAEAVYLMGWVGFLAIVPWVQALGWAFKPTTVIETPCPA